MKLEVAMTTLKGRDFIMGTNFKKDYVIEKKIGFAKKDKKGYARQSNVVEVTLRLDIQDSSKPKFGCSATVVGRNGRGANRCGQVMDYINENFLDKIANVESFRVLYGLWSKWHLNDMHAGTVEQRKCLETYSKERADSGISGRITFEESVEVLKKHNLYIVEHNGELYRYGSGFIYDEIDPTDLKSIYQFLDIDPATMKVIAAA